jgi:hypothetical protein
MPHDRTPPPRWHLRRGATRCRRLGDGRSRVGQLWQPRGAWAHSATTSPEGADAGAAWAPTTTNARAAAATTARTNVDIIAPSRSGNSMQSIISLLVDARPTSDSLAGADRACRANAANSARRFLCPELRQNLAGMRNGGWTGRRTRWSPARTGRDSDGGALLAYRFVEATMQTAHRRHHHESSRACTRARTAWRSTPGQRANRRDAGPQPGPGWARAVGRRSPVNLSSSRVPGRPDGVGRHAASTNRAEEMIPA